MRAALFPVRITGAPLAFNRTLSPRRAVKETIASTVRFFHRFLFTLCNKRNPSGTVMEGY